MTDVLDRIRRLVGRLAPAPACDACLAVRLDAGTAADIRTITGELASERGYTRERAICGLCGEDRMVIRKVR